MYENIVGLSIKGQFFNEEKNMIFFPEETDRISIVYGKNGSGKSTLTAGHREVIEESMQHELAVSLINRDGDIQSITEDMKQNIHVFNEAYVDNNIRIEGAGLNTIVLFGDQVDVEDEIRTLSTKITNVKSNVDSLTAERNKYDDINNILSPNYHMEKLKKVLKEVGGWAERDARIKGNKNNSSVLDRIITEIGDLKVTNNNLELEIQFKETEELLYKISDNNVSFPNVISKKAEIIKEEDNIIILLAEKVEKPSLSVREKMILSAIEEGFQSRVDETKRMFEDDTLEVCPYCYQALSVEYKKQIMDGINNVLNKDVEEHVVKLKKSFFEEYDFNKTTYEVLDATLATEIEKKIEICNELVRKYNEYITHKINNVFSPITISLLGLNDCIYELNILLDKLEKKRIDFNDLSKKAEKIKDKLIDINKQIAHNNIASDYASYKKQTKEKQKRTEDLQNKIKELEADNTELKRLQDKKKDIVIAIDEINKSLEYVFFSKNRLIIELKNNLYYLKSNGHYVKPCDVSSGERNIIALCYFFTQIMNNLELKQLYSIEKYVIIDDPVSSFDFENKVGIISFLKKQLSDMVVGNKNSKVVIFSHDLTTIFDLQKAASEIGSLTNRIGNNKTTFAWLEIKDKSLMRFTNKRSEYTELLKLMYSYAKDKSDIDKINIGNTMRRVLEAFSTFSYKKGIQEISCDPEIMRNVPHKEYFENLMYRLVLHNESHFEEQIQNFHDGINFYDFISEDEKQKTAKEVLCLMHLLNPLHVKAHLQDEACKYIIKWTANLV